MSLRNVRHVATLVQSEEAQIALKSVAEKNVFEDFDEGKSRKCTNNRKSQNFKNFMNEKILNCNRDENKIEKKEIDKGDLFFESCTIACNDGNTHNGNTDNGNTDNGYDKNHNKESHENILQRARPYSMYGSSGLRIAVCDVNIGAVGAATLLSTFVLPHMINACQCDCMTVPKLHSNNDESSCDNRFQNNSNSNSNSNCNDNDNNSNNNNNLFNDSSNSTNNNNNDEMNNENDNNNNNDNDIQYRTSNCSCGGYVVLTLKLVKNAKEHYIHNASQGASKILRAAGCWDFRVVHLGANSKNERTLVCRFGGIKSRK